MPQRKLICPTPEVARRLRERLARFRPGREFAVYGVAFGYQVVEVRKFAGYGFSWDGQRWSRAPRREAVCAAPCPAPASLTPVTATVRLPFKVESAAYIGAEQDGVLRWFGKTMLCAWSVADGVVALTLPAKVAAKRGLV